MLGGYGLLAYIILPGLWTHHEHQKGLADLPMVTRTGQGIPGDPMNVGLIGNQRDVVCAMHEAGWFPADPITLKSSIEIVGSVLLDRPYRDAPVSNLYYLDRREDLAFEKPAGRDPRGRVRSPPPPRVSHQDALPRSRAQSASKPGLPESGSQPV